MSVAVNFVMGSGPNLRDSQTMQTSVPGSSLKIKYDIDEVLNIACSRHGDPKLQDIWNGLVMGNIIHPICRLIADFADLQCTNGSNAISGEFMGSAPEIDVVEYRVKQALAQHRRGWHIVHPDFFSREYLEDALLGLMLWDGWLRWLPHQMQARMQIFHVPFDWSKDVLCLRGHASPTLARYWQVKKTRINSFPYVCHVECTKLPGALFRQQFEIIPPMFRINVHVVFSFVVLFILSQCLS